MVKFPLKSSQNDEVHRGRAALPKPFVASEGRLPFRLWVQLWIALAHGMQRLSGAGFWPGALGSVDG
jgi:hypothetical protein